MSSRLLLLCVAGSMSIAPAVGAQPHRGPAEHGHGPVVVGRGHSHLPREGGPNQPPPPLRVERMAARAGFEWIPGRWDWHEGQWVWLAGRWEKEHAGQHWNAGHWDQQGPTWVWTEGTWVAVVGGPVPPPPGPMPMPPPPGPMPPPGMMPPPMPPPMPPRPPHEWHIDRPTVSSYWPMKGKAGTRVTIHGENFPESTEVQWGPEPVRAAKVSPDRIVFDVPDSAHSATILLKTGHGRDLIVGDFEVADYDAEADAKRLEAQREAAARAAWAETQARLAHDQAARQAALDREWQDEQSTRESRREAREAEIRAKWKEAFLADPDTQSELTLHAQRVATLTRAKDLAEVKGDQKLGIRIDVATQRETDRHNQRMAALEAAFSSRGGRP